ncbi:MAG: hypothetical protein ABSD53_17670 [Terriglobales bacterium]|jgi:protocatechuate 3,4-dioxygenase beta subunit
MWSTLNRREAIKIGGVVFFSGAMTGLEGLLTACGSSANSVSAASSSCVASTNVTRGPYFVDNQSDPNITNDDVDSSIPNRSDIRSDTKGSTGTQSGLPLTLTIIVGSYSSGACSSIANAQIHVWHCNAQGVYSDVQAASNDDGANLTGENFLRGYQYTDSSGKVTFTTIYPGWYSGRAVHIHAKVRVFDGSGNVTTEATTQLFFDDAVSTAVYSANSSYSRSMARDTLDSDDSVYNSESPALLLNLTGSDTAGYVATVSIGIASGTIYGG